MLPTFADLGVPDDVVKLLTQRSITEPFPIQAAALPDALAGRDICGRAPTGSGKTLAFGLALILRTGDGKPRRPRGLVLVPTRELASQVAAELAPLAAARNRRIVAVYGGAGYEPQRKALRNGADIVVATPGRLEDLIARRDVYLENIDVAVVDEADRMADMGFLPSVRRILDAARPDRQTMLFSATLDGEIDVLVNRYQKDPCRHDVDTDDDRSGVEHLFWPAARDKRVQLTAGLVERHDRAIVFCRTRHGADRLARQLAAVGIDTAAIHGSRTQAQRERALSAFKDGKVQALIATDVAARGIHVDDVPCVVHFDPAADHKDYLHRSGRTGRAGASGTVVTLVGDEHRPAVKALQRGLGLNQGLDSPDLMVVRNMSTETPKVQNPAAQQPRAQKPHSQKPHAQRRRDDAAQPGRRGAKGARNAYGPRSAKAESGANRGRRRAG